MRLRLVIPVLVFFLIFHPALLYAAAPCECAGSDRIAGDSQKSDADFLPGLISLLLLSKKSFNLIAGPSTRLPILAFYRSGSYSTLVSSIATTETDEQPRSLYLDSSGNVIITYFGCADPPTGDPASGYYLPTAFNINGEGVIRLLSAGAGVDGQYTMTLQCELPDNTILGTYHLQSKVGQTVMEYKDASGQTVDSSTIQKPILKEIMDELKSYHELFCTGQTTANCIPDAIYSGPGLDPEEYMWKILQITSICIGIVSICAFTGPATGLAAWLWGLSIFNTTFELVDFFIDNSTKSEYREYYSDTLGYKDHYQCALVMVDILAMLGKKANITPSFGKCVKFVWKAVKYILNNYAYKVD